jgi:hypothetical protein
MDIMVPYDHGLHENIFQLGSQFLKEGRVPENLYIFKLFEGIQIWLLPYIFILQIYCKEQIQAVCNLKALKRSISHAALHVMYNFDRKLLCYKLVFNTGMK